MLGIGRNDPMKTMIDLCWCTGRCLEGSSNELGCTSLVHWIVLAMAPPLLLWLFPRSAMPNSHRASKYHHCAVYYGCLMSRAPPFLGSTGGVLWDLRQEYQYYGGLVFSLHRAFVAPRTSSTVTAPIPRSSVKMPNLYLWNWIYFSKFRLRVAPNFCVI